MKFLKKYSDYLESLQIDLSYQIVDLMESLNIWHDVLLSSIGAEQVDIFNTFTLPKDDFKDKLDIDYLADNNEFLNSLSSIGLKKSQIQNTDDFQTFVNKPCRFMLIYDVNSNELENPEYILFQTWNETLTKWEEAKLYKIKDDIKKFFDKLTSRTIEIVDGEQNFIYVTTNGNDWELQNLDKENDTYKRFFRKEELQQLLDDKKVKLNII
jgi:hypothetical protein